LSTIEDDLRQQRLRQQERQRLRQQAEQTEPINATHGEAVESLSCEGDDIPDFLPFPENRSSSYSLYHRGLHFWNHDVSSVSCLALSYAQELGPGPAASAWPALPGNRHSHHHYLPCPTTNNNNNTSRLRHIWYGRHLVQNLQVHAKALTLYSQAKWSQYQLPHGWYCPWDLTCKYHCHPSARTLDVSMMMNQRTTTTTTARHRTNSSSTSSSSLQYPLPTIVSAVQGGFVLCQPGTEEEDSNVEFNRSTTRRHQSSVSSASSSSRNRSICRGRVHSIRGYVLGGGDQNSVLNRVVLTFCQFTNDCHMFLICWTHSLDSFVGLICWTHLLDSFVGLICWTHLLDREAIHSVRLYHSKNTSAVEGARGYIGTLTSLPERRHASHQLKLYDLRNGNVFAHETLHVPVNDLCFGQDLILLAPSIVSGSGTDRLSPLFVPLHRLEGGPGLASPSALRTLQVDNFPQSDALRVELASLEKLVAFGHRNGQVSLLDLRNSTTCCGATTNPTGSTTKLNRNGLSNAPIGSATDLALLPSQQQLVVKYSFGSCQLHDLRKLSSFSSPASSSPSPVSPPHPGAVYHDHHHQRHPARSTTPNSDSGTQSSLVWNLPVPERFHCHATRSSRCNGLALDHPTTNAQVVFAPYMNSSNDSCLGSWSLRTGMFLGSKRLLAGTSKNPNPTSGDGHNEEDLIFTELCQQTTPAYYSLDSSNAAAPPPPPRQPGSSGGSSSSLGLWLKCGRFSSRNGTHFKAGSLHHVVVPGQWEEPI
jgi:hypothetical protein